MIKAGRPGPERLGAFSDGVIAIIITIMVLDLHPPHGGGWRALAALWPTFAGYFLSYFIVALVWVNHHHLLRYCEVADGKVIWSNIGLLFVVSLIPFFTAYMSENRMSAFSTALYAGIFLLLTLSFILFLAVVSRQLEDEESRAESRGAMLRNCIVAAVYLVAIPAAYVHAGVSLGLMIANALVYVVPNAFR
ncbi:MAG TPA: TMEM175 family protein, partial [Acidisarcina sp.]